jgi:nicotinamidase-related amidase
MLTTLEQKVDPAHAALLIIDMQHDYCSLGGEAHKAGRPVERNLTIIPRLKSVLAAAREAGVLVAHGITSTLPHGLSDSPVWLEQRTRSKYASDRMCMEGSWGEQILPEVASIDGELVVKKYRYSAFEGTPLELLLRANGIQSLVIGGVSTNTCVDSTIRSAFHRDFYVVVLGDCVTSYSQELHQATLEQVELRFGVVSDSAAVCQAWRNATRKPLRAQVGGHS